MPMLTHKTLKEWCRDVERWDISRLEEEQFRLFGDFSAGFLTEELFDEAYSVLDKAIVSKKHEQDNIESYNRAMRGVS